MIAAPKARSQGSNGAGGGALAFTAMSAAIAEVAVTANTAAARTSFFMTIPIFIFTKSRASLPQGIGRRTATKNLRGQSGSSYANGEAKNASKCRLFRRFGLFE